MGPLKHPKLPQNMIHLSFKLKDQFFLDKNNTKKDNLCVI